MGFPENKGYLVTWGPYNKDYWPQYVVSILGSPYFGKVPRSSSSNNAAKQIDGVRAGTLSGQSVQQRCLLRPLLSTSRVGNNDISTDTTMNYYYFHQYQ